MTFAMDGSIGGGLSLTIAEEIQEATLDGPDGLEAWRAGEAFHLIPRQRAGKLQPRSYTRTFSPG